MCPGSWAPRCRAEPCQGICVGLQDLTAPVGALFAESEPFTGVQRALGGRLLGLHPACLPLLRATRPPELICGHENPSDFGTSLLSLIKGA